MRDEPSLAVVAPPEPEDLLQPQPQSQQHEVAEEPQHGPQAEKLAAQAKRAGVPTTALSGRRTLAEATAEATAAAGSGAYPWEPAEQVDGFTLPDICETLLFDLPEQWDQLAEHLRHQQRAGQSVTALASCHRREGCTTVALCLALTLAQGGSRVVIVDYNFAQPGLAPALGLQPSVCWRDVLAGERALAEAVIQATDLPLAVLPLRSPGGPMPKSETIPRLRLCLGLLRQHYDHVLVDVGALAQLTPEQLGRTRADAAIVVHEPQHEGLEQLARAVQRIETAGLTVLGRVETFTSVVAL